MLEGRKAHSLGEALEARKLLRISVLLGQAEDISLVRLGELFGEVENTLVGAAGERVGDVRQYDK